LDYINANFVTFDRDRYKSIVTQGPLPTTIGDFFQMVTQEKVDTILMACNVVEDGRVRC
jgi:protein tyrosine phosphatase